MSLSKEREMIIRTAKMADVTVDDVVKANIVKKMMYRKSTLLAVGQKIIATKGTNVLDENWYWPDLDQVSGSFPVPFGATGAISQPVPWVNFGIQMQVAEYRFCINDDAIARGQENWQMEAQVRAGSRFFARCKDSQILTQVYNGAYSSNGVTAGAKWNSGSADADPEADILAAWNKLMKNSNVDLEDMKSVCIVYPAEVDGVFRSLKMISNIQQSLAKYLGDSFGFGLYPTRYYSSSANLWDKTAGIGPNALMVVNSEETAFHMPYDGTAIPLAEAGRIRGRGMEYVIKNIFGTKVVPHSSTVTTSDRIAKIATVI